MPAKPNFKSNHSPRKLVLRAAVSVAGILWLSSCAPPENNAANNATGNAADNGSTPAPTPTPTKAPQSKVTTFTLFVPNDQALLSKQIVKDTSLPAGATYEQKSKRALELLFKRLEFLPPQTRLLEAPKKEKNGNVRVNLSKPFLKLDAAHETPVALTLDAISRTLGALDTKNGKPGKPAKVHFLAEGKMIRTLSQFSLDEPWQTSVEDESTAEKPAKDESAPDKPGGGV